MVRKSVRTALSKAAVAPSKGLCWDIVWLSKWLLVGQYLAITCSQRPARALNVSWRPAGDPGHSCAIEGKHWSTKPHSKALSWAIPSGRWPRKDYRSSMTPDSMVTRTRERTRVATQPDIAAPSTGPHQCLRTVQPSGASSPFLVAYPRLPSSAPVPSSFSTCVPPGTTMGRGPSHLPLPP